MPKSMTKAKSTRKSSPGKNRKTSSSPATKSRPSAGGPGEADPETLERVGWLLLDAAEYQRDLAAGPEAPADKWLRGSTRRDLLRRSRKLADDGDPLRVADQITEMVRQAGSDGH